MQGGNIMKKTYNTPEISVTVFNSTDVITLSSGEKQTSINSVARDAIDF